MPMCLGMESHQNLREREIGSISAIPASLEGKECLRTGLIWPNVSVLVNDNKQINEAIKKFVNKKIIINKCFQF